MIKAYYKSNQDYGADELNNVVKYLRTDGIYGEITDCLKVTNGTGTTVNIADGIGWVGGCGIEVVEGATVTLPTTSGTYYIYMKVETQSDHTVDATITYTTTTQPANANCILASVVVASSTISTVTDRRVNSTFNGITQILTGTANWEAGDKVLFSDGVIKATNDNSYAKVCEYRMGNSGVVRVKFDLNIVYDTSRTAYAKIYKNDVAAGTERSTNSTTPVTFSEDITVTAGDKISIYAKTSYSSYYARVSKVMFSISRGSDIIQIV